MDADLAPGAAFLLTTTCSVASGAAHGNRTSAATADTAAAVVERDEGDGSSAEVSLAANAGSADTNLDAPSVGIIAGVPYGSAFRVADNGSMPTPGTQVVICRCHVCFPRPIVDENDANQTWLSVTVQPLQPGVSMDLEQAMVSTENSSPSP